jgi:hypothetical protein
VRPVAERKKVRKKGVVWLRCGSHTLEKERKKKRAAVAGLLGCGGFGPVGCLREIRPELVLGFHK